MAGRATSLWRRCRPCSWTRSTWVRALPSPDPTAHPESARLVGVSLELRGPHAAGPRRAPRPVPHPVTLPWTRFGLAGLLQTPADPTSARLCVQSCAALWAPVLGRWVCGPTRFHSSVLPAAASWDSCKTSPSRGVGRTLFSSYSAPLPSSSPVPHIFGRLQLSSTPSSALTAFS